jgi:ethanolamine ammonia-lyase small subunit
MRQTKMADSLHPVPAPAWIPDLLHEIRKRTPARIFTGNAGPSYRTATLLELRRDHAAAVDAVHAEVDLAKDFGDEFVHRWELFEIRTQAATKDGFLVQPDLGRRLSSTGRQELVRRCPLSADLQVVIGDGLSAAAVIAQAPALLPLLESGALDRGLRFGQPFFIRHCRVGILNEIGDALDPCVVVLLIGERPGLATAESLSAYMAYRPRSGHTDAQRNLISNIHARGVPALAASERILNLAERMRRLETSGVAVKEECLDSAARKQLPG